MCFRSFQSSSLHVHVPRRVIVRSALMGEELFYFDLPFLSFMRGCDVVWGPQCASYSADKQPLQGWYKSLFIVSVSAILEGNTYWVLPPFTNVFHSTPFNSISLKNCINNLDWFPPSGQFFGGRNIHHNSYCALKGSELAANTWSNDCGETSWAKSLCSTSMVKNQCFYQ